ncbi:MAG: phage minor head protein [Alphaproteobacteria bacterium]|nr:phage minor head protein [Alphaproteobacteria bacterium]
MPTRRFTTRAIMESRYDRAERLLLAAAVRSVLAARAALPGERALAEAFATGNIEPAVEASAQAAARVIAQASFDVYLDSGRRTARLLEEALNKPVRKQEDADPDALPVAPAGAAAVVIDFDAVNDFAIARHAANRLERVREWTDDQRTIAQRTIAEGIEEGTNPRAQARRFRASTGLTARQHAAVANYRRLLMRAHEGDLESMTRALRDRRFDASVRRSARTGQPLTRAQIARMVERYQDRYIKYRAEVVARTEALGAVNAGSYDAQRLAVQEGVVERDAITREWVAARDDRVRDTHVEVNGQRVGVDEPFIVGGAQMMFPGDPSGPAREVVSCRCTLVSSIRL